MCKISTSLFKLLKYINKVLLTQPSTVSIIIWDYIYCKSNLIDNIRYVTLNNNNMTCYNKEYIIYIILYKTKQSNVNYKMVY